jgi:hypothetical protein
MHSPELSVRDRSYGVNHGATRVNRALVVIYVLGDPRLHVDNRANAALDPRGTIQRRAENIGNPIKGALPEYSEPG